MESQPILMTLTRFCELYGWPSARVSRRVRAAAFAQAFGTEDPEEEAIRAASIDFAPPEAGLRVRKPAGKTSFHYQISDPAALDRWLADRGDRPPLGEEEIEALLEAAQMFVKLTDPSGPYQVVTEKGETARRSEELDKLRERLQPLLRQAGRT